MTETTHQNETLIDVVDHGAAGAQRRLRGFAFHMATFLVVMSVVIIVNFIYTPHNWWFVLPLILWGSPLALHAAYAMGLFRVFGKRSTGPSGGN